MFEFGGGCGEGGGGSRVKVFDVVFPFLGISVGSVVDLEI